MTPEARIQAKIYDIIARGLNGQIVESDNVECKAAFPEGDDKERAIRQIGGCMNAALGNDVFFLVGVQERTFAVVGANEHELANWWNGAASMFAPDSVPRYATHVVSYDGKSVVALVFDSSAPPYLVKNQWWGKQNQKSDIKYEVPWREGNRARTATRQDMLKMFLAVEKTPDCEVLAVDLRCGPDSWAGGPASSLSAAFYVVPRSSERIVLPWHQCEVMLRYDDPKAFPARVNTAMDVQGMIPYAASPLVRASGRDVVLDGPGQITFTAATRTVIRHEIGNVEFLIKLGVSGAAAPLVVGGTLIPHMRDVTQGSPAWKYRVA